MSNKTEETRLIAEFMGWRKVDGETEIYINPQDKDDGWDLKDMWFNSSWNGLMPAVEQISMGFDGIEMKMEEGFGYCEIKCYDNDGKLFKIILHEGDDLFDIVYDAIVEYIKVHNAQKKKGDENE